MNEDALISAQRIRERAQGFQPEIAVLLGSGWSGVAEGLAHRLDIPYADLPGFPLPGIKGHPGQVRIGRIDRSGEGSRQHRDVLLLMGREHAYEHGNASAMRGVVQTIAALGCQALVLTNAAGSLRDDMPPGSLMLMSDHLNLVQRSPLMGGGGDDRFVDMSQAYDPDLRAQAAWLMKQEGGGLYEGTHLHEGVYAWVLGPQFETPAEIRMLRTLGADAVGMSTVPECIAARHVGLRVLGLSLITNMAAGLSTLRLSHEQTLNSAAQHQAHARRVLERLLWGLELELPDAERVEPSTQRGSLS